MGRMGDVSNVIEPAHGRGVPVVRPGARSNSALGGVVVIEARSTRVPSNSGLAQRRTGDRGESASRVTDQVCRM